MSAPNPYAPPRDDEPGAAQAARGMLLLGNVLTVDRDGTLPPLCPFSGEPTTDIPTSHRLVWTPPWFLVVAFMSPLLAALLYFFVRRTARLHFALGASAQRRRRDAISLAVFGGLGAALSFILGAVAEFPWLLALGALLGVTALLLGMVRSRLYRISRIDPLKVQLYLRPEAAEAYARLLRSTPGSSNFA